MVSLGRALALLEMMTTRGRSLLLKQVFVSRLLFPQSQRRRLFIFPGRFGRFRGLRRSRSLGRGQSDPGDQPENQGGQCKGIGEGGPRHGTDRSVIRKIPRGKGSFNPRDAGP